MRGDHSPNDSVQGCVHITGVEQMGGGRESGVKEGLPEEEKCGPGLDDGGEGRGRGGGGWALPACLFHKPCILSATCCSADTPVISRPGHCARHSPVSPSTKLVLSLKSYPSFKARLRFHLPLSRPPLPPPLPSAFCT